MAGICLHPLQVPILHPLSEKQRWQLASTMQGSSHKKGSVIFRTGEPADRFYVVQQGAFSCFTGGQQGQGVCGKDRTPQ